MRYEVNAVMQLRWLIHWFVRKVYVILSAGAMRILCEDAVPNTMKPQSLIIKKIYGRLHARWLLEEARKLIPSGELCYG